jgi:hypothetical protein
MESPVYKAMVVESLAQAEEHVVMGQKHITRQRELVAKLERNGQDSSEAQRLLREFEEIYAMHLANRERLRHEAASIR